MREINLLNALTGATIGLATYGFILLVRLFYSLYGDRKRQPHRKRRTVKDLEQYVAREIKEAQKQYKWGGDTNNDYAAARGIEKMNLLYPIFHRIQDIRENQAFVWKLWRKLKASKSEIAK